MLSIQKFLPENKISLFFKLSTIVHWLITYGSNEIPVLPQPHYNNSDLCTVDIFLFLKMTVNLKSHQLESVDEIQKS